MRGRHIVDGYLKGRFTNVAASVEYWKRSSLQMLRVTLWRFDAVLAHFRIGLPRLVNQNDGLPNWYAEATGDRVMWGILMAVLVMKSTG